YSFDSHWHHAFRLCPKLYACNFLLLQWALESTPGAPSILLRLPGVHILQSKANENAE
ncbi:unnamed protein product, partial [Musa banksii]